jgi:hypothetical protein
MHMHTTRCWLMAMAMAMAGCLPPYPVQPGTQGSSQTPGVGGGGGSDGGAPASAPDLGGSPSSTHDLAGSNTPAADMAQASSNCIAIATPLTNGHHNAGAACAGCHDGTTATLWTASGTLYDTVAGANAIAGATIVLTDANGQQVSIVTSSNGNFYTQSALALPVSARASGCPNDVAMVSKASSGDCNSCHNSSLRVHLP